MLYILVVIFIATVFRSAFGFGESLIAVPLLALRLPLDMAVPLSVMLSIAIAAVVVIQDWQKIHFRSAAGLVAFTLLGIPVGLLLLTRVEERLVKLILGIIIVAFSLYFLVGRPPKELKKDHLSWVFGCGFLAGLLGGAYGLNGPPLAIYGAKRRWTAQHFRATLQGYFLIASVVGLAGYWISGLLVPLVLHYFLFSIPVMLPAIFIGRAINHRLPVDGFFRYVYLVLLAIGIFLMVWSLAK